MHPVGFVPHALKAQACMQADAKPRHAIRGTKDTMTDAWA